MVEVIVLCEGQTEREFCREIVAPHLLVHDITLAGTLVGKPQRKRGGIRPWPAYRSELLRLGKARADRHLAVLVDYYAMPGTWPGRAASSALPATERGASVERALREDLAEPLPNRFHPCVQLHEFESLLFVAPELAALSIAIGGGISNHKHIATQMKAIKAEFGGDVERINDSPETAPSKRLQKLIKGYDKVGWGVTAAADISIESLRAGCPWLDRWVSRLATLSGPAAPRQRFASP